eukprot:10344276-Ditylum_brightwellii.AAC.1
MKGDNVVSRVLLGNGGFADGVPLGPNLEGNVVIFCHGGKLGELQGLAFCSNGSFVHSDFQVEGVVVRRDKCLVELQS